jgi:hypothetical protein
MRLVRARSGGSLAASQTASSDAIFKLQPHASPARESDATASLEMNAL